MRRGAAFIGLLAVVAGCGGGDDREEAQQTVRDFVTATRERDADLFCEEVATREFVEEATGATGDDAIDACKRQFRSITGLRLRLVRIARTSIEGERARVTAVLERQGQRIEQTLRLEKEDGDWKIAGAAE